MKLLAIAAAALLTGLLTACTSFAPVYGDRSGAGMEAVRFNFASPDGRLEQIVLDRLKLAFPGQAGPNDPLLDISVTTNTPPGSRSNAFSVGKPINTRVEATLTVTRGDAVQFTATRFADTAYQSGKLTPVDIASATGAQETAAKAVAEALRAAVLAGYPIRQ
jgi:hypothetical protein